MSKTIDLSSEGGGEAYLSDLVYHAGPHIGRIHRTERGKRMLNGKICDHPHLHFCEEMIRDRVETPYGRLYVDPEELVIGRLLQADGQIPDISAEMAFFEKYVKPGDSVIDVGCNYGLFTLALLDLVGPTGQVAAIDPNYHMLRALRKSIGDREVGAVSSDPGVKLLLMACGARKAHGTLRFDPRGSGGTQVLSGGAGGVSVETLDDAGAIVLRPSAIKIDAEGMDIEVLQGAERILREDRPVVIFEWNEGAIASRGGDGRQSWQDLLALIRDLDYQVGFLRESNYALTPVEKIDVQ
jgi:FkbM family methyltransferase